MSVFSKPFNKKTIIIATEERNICITLPYLIQILIVASIVAVITRFSVKYHQYKYQNDYILIINENNALKAEHKKLYKRFDEYDKSAEKVNEYITTIVDNKKNIKVSKPIKKAKVNSYEEISAQLNNHELYAYAVIDARKEEIEKKIKKLNIHTIEYDRKTKTIKISKEDNSNRNKDNYILNEKSIGGDDAAVRNISYITESKTVNFPQISKNKITNKNFKHEISKQIIIEKAFSSLPFGAPTNTNYIVTSKYGLRKNPIKTKKSNESFGFHKGVDVVLPKKNVLSTNNGIVKFAGHKSGYGNCVIIDHTRENTSLNVKTYYAHLESISVKKGQKVFRGQEVGIQGTTGRSTGPHVHYEIHIDKQPVDPIGFIKMPI